jgi:hypothetical protein
MNSMRFAAFLLLPLLVAADAPLRSGLQPKQRPGPYSALVSVGKERGQQHCFICEAEDRPVVIVFTRSLNEPLGKLVHRLDALLAKHKDAELKSWMTVLAEDQTAMDAKIVEWSKKHSTGNVPIAVFEDKVGPPTYRISADADTTVIVSVKRSVAANFAFRVGELNDAVIDEITKAIAKVAAK